MLIANNTKIKSLPKDSIKLEKVFSGMLQIGYNFIGTLDFSRDRSVLNVTKGGKIYVSGRTQLGTGVNISIGSKGMLIFGENISVSGKSSIICEKKIEIGDNSLISWECLIMDDDFHFIYDKDSVQQRRTSEEIYIGKHCWICCRSTLLKGAKIPDGCVIGASSVCARKCDEAGALYCGSPLRKIKSNIVWSE